MSVLNFCKKCTRLCKIGIITIPNLIISRNLGKSYGKTHNILKVTVLGATGHVGQPLCLMLKQSPLIDELAVHDIIDPCPFATELGHVDTRCKISAYTGPDQLTPALEGSNIVIVLVAQRGSANLSFSRMFDANAHLMQNLAVQFATSCPSAQFAIVTNPVNSFVPLMCNVLAKNGVNPKNVFGITTLNSVRANALAAEILGTEPECVFVPVIGGNSEKTIVPVFSETRPCADFSNEELEKLTFDVQNAHHDIYIAKQKQSGYLACAFAVSRFIISLIKALRNQSNIVECAFVKSNVHPNARYLATPLLLGPGGLQKNLGLPRMSDYERCQLENACLLLQEDVQKGEEYVSKMVEAYIPAPKSQKISNK